MGGKRGNQYEEDLRLIKEYMSGVYDNTSITLFSALEVSTNVTVTGSCSVKPFINKTFYIDLTGATADVTTGFTITFYGRAIGTKPWALLNTFSGVKNTSVMYKVVGSGTAASGVGYFSDFKVLVYNEAQEHAGDHHTGLISLGALMAVGR